MRYWFRILILKLVINFAQTINICWLWDFLFWGFFCCLNIIDSFHRSFPIYPKTIQVWNGFLVGILRRIHVPLHEPAPMSYINIIHQIGTILNYIIQCLVLTSVDVRREMYGKMCGGNCRSDHITLTMIVYLYCQSVVFNIYSVALTVRFRFHFMHVSVANCLFQV